MNEGVLICDLDGGYGGPVFCDQDGNTAKLGIVLGQMEQVVWVESVEHPLVAFCFAVADKWYNQHSGNHLQISQEYKSRHRQYHHLKQY